VSESSIPRYCPERPLPPYSYVPGLAPHPTSDPRGHSHGVHEPQPSPLTESSYCDNVVYLYAIDLFNHGFYWEAHEAWEALWHAAGRSGPTADFLKALIKLAAAGVKLREGRAAGVKQHAERAAELFHCAGSSGIATTRGFVFGLSLGVLLSAAEEMAKPVFGLPENAVPDVMRRVPLVLLLDNR
jgi:uncharacterized protein